MLNNITDVVKNLIIINVIIFVGTIALPDHYRSMGVLHFFKSEEFMPFQVVSSMFMHADFMHLLFNMFSLFFLGPMVEKTLGAKRFLILYLTAGFGATALHVGINAYEYYNAIQGVPQEIVDILISDGRQAKINTAYHTPAVIKAANIINSGVLGASGCVYGVIIAFATMFPNLKLMVFPIPVPLPAKILGVGMVAIGLYSGFGGVNDGIAHFAHVGGAIVGFLLVKYWKMSNLR